MSTLDLIILGALRDCDGIPRTAKKLYYAVNEQSPAPATVHDIAARLVALENAGAVFGASAADGLQYTITVRGKSQLAEAGL